MQSIEIHCDGGCRPNPGMKYGSYEIIHNGYSIHKVERQEFGHGTNNEAEFETLIAALRWADIEGPPLAFSDAEMIVFTDSTIVRNRLAKKNVLLKKYPESSGRMFALASRCLEMLSRYSRFEVRWVDREKNVVRFGH